MKNILVVDPYTNIVGPHQVMFRIIRQLHGNRYHFSVVIPDKAHMYEQIKQTGVEVIVIPELAALTRTTSIIQLMQDIANLVVSVTRLVQYLRKHDICLVHSVTAACWVGGISAKILGIPSIYHIHDLTLADPKWLNIVMGIVLGLTSDHIICVSQAARKALPAPRLTNCRSTVVYNAVDPEEFYPNNGQEKHLRNVLGLPLDSPIVGSFGSLDVRKGQELLVKAAIQVVKTMPEVQFIIVGGDSPNARRDGYGDKVRKLAAQHGLSRNVRFLGPRTDVPMLMRAIDLVVQPSVIEAGPLVPLEAMASGIPVIATNTGANPEEIIHGETGILVPVGDDIALAHAIIQLLRDKERRKQMGQTGREWVKTRFAIGIQAEIISSIYEAVINKRKPCIISRKGSWPPGRSS